MPVSPSAVPAISVRNVRKRFGAKRALDGIDLEVAGPGVTAVLGPNGAGKTTLVHCILGLTKPGSGKISVFGKPPGRMSARRRTGVMLQDAHLPDLLTPREHIALFSSYYPDPLGGGEVLAMCNITDFADRPYKRLSGGQKRRVQFALAVLGRPDLVFLDEPSPGLDPESRRDIWRIVRMLAGEGKSVILTTHHLDEADILADRIVVLNEGRVIADAPTPDIRRAVGGAFIQCVTHLPDETLGALPSVRSVRRAGRFAEMLSGDAVATLKALLAADPGISDLTVKKPSLEEAFLELTGTGAGGES